MLSCVCNITPRSRKRLAYEYCFRSGVSKSRPHWAADSHLDMNTVLDQESQNYDPVGYRYYEEVPPSSVFVGLQPAKEPRCHQRTTSELHVGTVM